MRIQHNLSAMNSHRQLGSNNSAVSNNLEKLSSGFRINRAGDDAAGLAISEKMRAQIKGLDTAQKNAQDGISLVQTAEGALTEVHSMLNRMTELATQSANGTYDNETDRDNLQKEVKSLQTEIDRISESTNYNGINLLDGSLGGGSAAGAKAVSIKNATTSDSAPAKGKYTASAAITATTGTNVGEKVTYSITYKDNADGQNKTLDINLTVGKDSDGTLKLYADDGKTYTMNATGATAVEVGAAITGELAKSGLADKFTISGGTTPAFEAKENGSAGAVITSISETTYDNAGQKLASKAVSVALTTPPKDSFKELAASGVTAFDGTNADDAIFTVNGKKFVLAASNIDVSGLDKNVTVLTGTAFDKGHAQIISQQTGLNVTESGGTLTFKPGAGKAGSGGLKLQIGDTSDDFNSLSVAIGNMSSSSLGVGSIDISTQDGAKAAIDVIKDAINKVSSTRGDLGAIQNRLDHTINNLGVSSENMSAAESRIRDVDMAKEMMDFTKNNILTQASQAMLAQANQLPQGVLQLLQ